jgi:hypothetical protein
MRRNKKLEEVMPRGGNACPYVKYGCEHRELIPFKELRTHQEGCIYVRTLRMYVCPSLSQCGYMGSYPQLYQHLRDETLRHHLLPPQHLSPIRR